MIIYAKLQCSHVRHQYGIFGGKSQTSFLGNATRARSEEGRLFSQAKFNDPSRSNLKPLFAENFSKNSTKTIRLFALYFYEVRVDSAFGLISYYLIEISSS